MNKRLQTPRARRLAALLGLSLLATTWVALQGEGEDEAVVAVAPRGDAAKPAGKPAAQAAAARSATPALATVPWPGAPVARSAWPALRQAQAWGPPPAPPVRVAAAAAAPVAAEPAAPAGPPPAPPFPYTLIGRVEDGPLIQALLSSPRRTLGVKAKDVIDGQWRVDAVDARSVTLTWLPGGQALTLAWRPSS